MLSLDRLKDCCIFECEDDSPLKERLKAALAFCEERVNSDGCLSEEVLLVTLNALEEMIPERGEAREQTLAYLDIAEVYAEINCPAIAKTFLAKALPLLPEPEYLRECVLNSLVRVCQDLSQAQEADTYHRMTDYVMSRPRPTSEEIQLRLRGMRLLRRKLRALKGLHHFLDTYCAQYYCPQLRAEYSAVHEVTREWITHSQDFYARQTELALNLKEQIYCELKDLASSIDPNWLYIEIRIDTPSGYARKKPYFSEAVVNGPRAGNVSFLSQIECIMNSALRSCAAWLAKHYNFGSTIKINNPQHVIELISDRTLIQFENTEQGLVTEVDSSGQYFVMRRQYHWTKQEYLPEPYTLERLQAELEMTGYCGQAVYYVYMQTHYPSVIREVTLEEIQATVIAWRESAMIDTLTK